MYNNNFNNNGFKGHSFRPGNNGYGQAPYMPNVQPPKKSGAKYSKIGKGNFVGATIVNAWNKSRKGMITCTVSPYKKSDELVKSESGNEYMKMIAVVRYERTGVEKIIPVLRNLETNVIVLKEIGMVITPNGSGRTSTGKAVKGYFGTMKTR